MHPTWSCLWHSIGRCRLARGLQFEGKVARRRWRQGGSLLAKADSIPAEVGGQMVPPEPCPVYASALLPQRADRFWPRAAIGLAGP